MEAVSVVVIGGQSTRYRVNEPAVVHQSIDGELVIIHLDRGLYYSVDRSGARIWSAFLAGAPAEAVVAAVTEQAGTSATEAAGAVEGFIDQLRAEELIVPAPDTDRSGASDRAPAWADTGEPFAPPTMQRYDDLQDLLLLDPIHAVDESGWPDRRDGA